MSHIKSKPDGYHTITPSIVVPNSVHAIALYEKVFNAEQIELIRQGDRVVHAEIKIGDSVVMMADENKQWGLTAPSTIGGVAASLYLYVDDVDALFNKATEHGFEVLMAPDDMFWGDRFAQVKDPFGQIWSLATHKEDLTHDEIQRRMDEMG